MTSLPKAPIKGDAETRRFLEAVRQELIALGKDTLTFDDLNKSSFWERLKDKLPENEVEADEPTVPSNLVASGAFSYIILTWGYEEYAGHAWTRLYRSATNVFADAEVVANVNGKVYSDFVGSNKTYYYWATNVNVNGVESAPNATNGTVASTLPDTAYILDLLENSITESQLYQDLGARINLIDAADTVVNSVNARLKSLDTQIQTDITDTRDALRLELENYTDDQISASELSLTQTFNNTLTGYVTSSYLTNNYYTAAGTNSAISAATLNLATKTELDSKVNTSTLTNEYYTKTATDSAIALATLNLVTQTQLNNYVTTATLSNNYYTKTATDSAIAAATLNLATKTELSGYVTTASLDQNYYTITEADSAISAATTNLATKTELSGYVTTANLTTNYYTKTGTDGAISAATQNLVSTTTLNNYVTTATLTNSYYTKTQTDSAISSSVNQVSARLNNFNGSTGVTIEQASTAQASSISGLQGQYTVKIDNNGYVSGFGLASTANNSTPFSDFQIRADRFAISSPSGPGIAPSYPFTVLTTTQTIDGTSVAPGVYIKSATIMNGAITNAKIKDATIESAKIASLDAGKITTGFLDAARVQIDGVTLDTYYDSSIGRNRLQIKDLGVTTAKIGNAQITTAKIQNAAVETLKIAGNAVTLPLVYSASDLYVTSTITISSGSSCSYVFVGAGNGDYEYDPEFFQFIYVGPNAGDYAYQCNAAGSVSGGHTVLETPFITVGDTAAQGGLILVFYATMDATALKDAGQLVGIMVDTGSGYSVVRQTKVGATTSNGNTYAALPVAIATSISGVTQARIKVVTGKFLISNASTSNNSYLRDCTLSVLGAKR